MATKRDDFVIKQLIHNHNMAMIKSIRGLITRYLKTAFTFHSHHRKTIPTMLITEIKFCISSHLCTYTSILLKILPFTNCNKVFFISHSCISYRMPLKFMCHNSTNVLQSSKCFCFTILLLLYRLLIHYSPLHRATLLKFGRIDGCNNNTILSIFCVQSIKLNGL